MKKCVERSSLPKNSGYFGTEGQMSLEQKRDPPLAKWLSPPYKHEIVPSCHPAPQWWKGGWGPSASNVIDLQPQSDACSCSLLPLWLRPVLLRSAASFVGRLEGKSCVVITLFAAVVFHATIPNRLFSIHSSSKRPAQRSSLCRGWHRRSDRGELCPAPVSAADSVSAQREPCKLLPAPD